MNLNTHFRKALEQVRDQSAARARQEVLATFGEVLLKALPALVGGRAAWPAPPPAADPVDPVTALLKALPPEPPADRLSRIAAEEGLGEHLRWVQAYEPWEYTDLLAAVADELRLERVTKADRSHLVRKVIRNRLGRRQVVWVRPESGDGNESGRGVRAADGGADAGAGDDRPAAMTREQVAESRTVIATAVADPSRINPEQLRDLARHIDAITKDEAKGLLRQLGQKVSGDQMAVATRLLAAVRAGRDEGRAVGAGLADGREAGDHLPTMARVRAARAAVAAAGGPGQAPLAVADELRQAESAHRQATRADLGRRPRDQELAQPTATHGKPELTGPSGRVVNWARGERKKVLDQFAGTPLEAAARDYFQQLTTAEQILDHRDRHAANIRAAAEQAGAGSARLTPAEFDRRMAELDPRDSGNVSVPEKPRQPSLDDREIEARRAAGERLRQAEGWLADQPGSVAAEQAVARARRRLEEAGGGEGELPPPEPAARPIRRDEATPAEPATPATPASPDVDHVAESTRLHTQASEYEQAAADATEEGDKRQASRLRSAARALRTQADLHQRLHAAKEGAKRTPAEPATSAPPTTPPPAAPPAPDTGKRVAEIRARLAQADDLDGPGVTAGEQTKLMEELDRLTGGGRPASPPATPRPAAELTDAEIAAERAALPRRRRTLAQGERERELTRELARRNPLPPESEWTPAVRAGGVGPAQNNDRSDERTAQPAPAQNPASAVDNPAPVGNTTPVQPQSAGANQGGGAMQATTEMKPLVGSEKQVSYAAQFRDKRLGEAEKRLGHMVEDLEADIADGESEDKIQAARRRIADMRAGIEYLKQRAVSATGWLDHGRYAPGNMLAAAVGAWLNRQDKAAIEPYKAFIALNAKAEGGAE